MTPQSKSITIRSIRISSFSKIKLFLLFLKGCFEITKANHCVQIRGLVKVMLEWKTSLERRGKEFTSTTALAEEVIFMRGLLTGQSDNVRRRALL